MQNSNVFYILNMGIIVVKVVLIGQKKISFKVQTFMKNCETLAKFQLCKY